MWAPGKPASALALSLGPTVSECAKVDAGGASSHASRQVPSDPAGPLQRGVGGWVLPDSRRVEGKLQDRSGSIPSSDTRSRAPSSLRPRPPGPRGVPGAGFPATPLALGFSSSFLLWGAETLLSVPPAAIWKQLSPPSHRGQGHRGTPLAQEHLWRRHGGPVGSAGPGLAPGCVFIYNFFYFQRSGPSFPTGEVEGKVSALAFSPNTLPQGAWRRRWFRGEHESVWPQSAPRRDLFLCAGTSVLCKAPHLGP